MPAVTKIEIETLVKVQKIEVEAAKIKAFLNEVPNRISRLDGELTVYISGVENDKAAVEDYNKKYRELETDVQLNLGKIQKSQEKLRSVKTNKEYQSSLKEIDDIKSANSKLEDEMLAVLEQIDQAEKALAVQQQHYTRIVAEAKAEKASVEKEAQERKKKLLELESNRTAIANGVGRRTA